MKYRSRRRPFRQMFPIAAIALSGLLLQIATPVLADSPLPFTDISDSYAKQQITDLQQHQIVSGENGQYLPQANVTRSQFVTMLDRTLQIQPVDSSIQEFQDVPSNEWDAPYVSAGVQLGIFNGTSSNTFGPDLPITREQVATALVRALQALNPSVDTVSSFADSASVDSWAAPYVAAAQRLGLMSGFDGQFRPQAPITREEMAVVLDQLINDPRWSQALQNVTSTPPSGQVTIGWDLGDTTADFENHVQALDGMINTLSPRWFFLDANQQMTDSSDPSLVTWAHQNGKKVWALVGNRFDPNITHDWIATDSSRETLVNNLVAAVQKDQLDGLNLDFEGISTADRDNFTAFVTLLTTQLHAINAQLSIDLPPDQNSDWDSCYDYKALGQTADDIVLMGYDEHWSGDTQPGSVASLPWVTSSLQTLTAEVPKNKVILGIPFYTADWYKQAGVEKSSDLTMNDEADLLGTTQATMDWDATSGQYVATYSQSGINHTIWVEDGRSLSLKYQLALQTGIAGTAFWYTGAETSDVWQSLQNVQRYDNFLQNASN